MVEIVKSMAQIKFCISGSAWWPEISVNRATKVALGNIYCKNNLHIYWEAKPQNCSHFIIFPPL